MDAFAVKLGNNIGKIILVTVIISFTLVQNFGSYPNNEYTERVLSLNKYFSDLANVEVKHSTKSGNGIFVKLVYSNGIPNKVNNSDIIKNYKVLIIKKICAYPDYLKQLKNGKYISVDLIDGDQNFAKSLFNLNIKLDRCGI